MLPEYCLLIPNPAVLGVRRFNALDLVHYASVMGISRGTGRTEALFFVSDCSGAAGQSPHSTSTAALEHAMTDRLFTR